MTPRSRSSGALSIWSYALNVTFGFVAASTFVIAAVNDVFPWSTCPIVPMFTCGLRPVELLLGHLFFAASTLDNLIPSDRLEPTIRIELMTSSLPRTRSAD